MNIFKSVKDEVLVPIHPAGWPFIFLFILASAIITYFWAGIPASGQSVVAMVYLFFSQSKAHNAGDRSSCHCTR
jgi:phosphatidylserine decarboxylase